MLDAVHAGEVKHDSALQRNRLTVIARARAARGHRKIICMAIAQNFLNFRGAERLHHDVAQLSIELLAQHRRIPVEIARQLLDDLRIGEDARGIAGK